MAPVQKQLYRAALLTLLIGLGSAAALYLTAQGTADSTLVDEYLQSKRYGHEVRAYGGTVSLLADQAWRWLEGLWQGRALAFTLAGLTLVVAGALLFVARHADRGEGG